MTVVQDQNSKDGFTIQGKAYIQSSPNENELPCSKCSVVNLTIYECQVLNECLPIHPFRPTHLYLAGFSFKSKQNSFLKVLLGTISYSLENINLINCWSYTFWV